MSYMNYADTINGAEGRAYTIINGTREEMFYLKSIEAKVEKTKSEGKTLGKHGTQHKATGWNGSGSATLYYVTSKFRKQMLNYMKNGVDTYFDVQIVNDDPTSTVGTQTVILRNVNLDSVIMAKLDLDSDDPLEEDVDFTFEGIDITGSFSAPTLNS
ncbi:MAG: phage protein [Oscillospiraceae bacterium]|nr:phage protein [Oscillospiraceae bacterium]